MSTPDAAASARRTPASHAVPVHKVLNNNVVIAIDESGRGHARQLWQGFVVGVTNPKTLAFFVAVLPQFVDLKAGAVPLQLLELGLVFAVLAVVSDSMWVLAAAAARTWFARSPKCIERLTATGGGMMIGLGGMLLVTGPKH